MVGILIVAHGTLGESLLHCASHVMGGRPPQLMQIGVSIHDAPAMILPQARELLRQLDEGTGVLVLTDVYGATPGNIAARLLVLLERDRPPLLEFHDPRLGEFRRREVLLARAVAGVERIAGGEDA